MATGRTVTDNCGLVIDSPSTVTAGSPAGAALALPVADCGRASVTSAGPGPLRRRSSSPVVYPLPWDFRASSIYQNIPGVPIRASYVATMLKSGRRWAGTSPPAPARPLPRVIRRSFGRPDPTILTLR